MRQKNLNQKKKFREFVLWMPSVKESQRENVSREQLSKISKAISVKMLFYQGTLLEAEEKSVKSQGNLLSERAGTMKVSLLTFLQLHEHTYKTVVGDQ